MKITKVGIRKFPLLLTCGVLLLLFFAQSLFAQNPRVRYTINDNWIFSAVDDTNAEKVDFFAVNAKKVNLPHTWNSEDTFDDEPGYRRGVSWYRKELNFDSNLKNKRIFLYFEGANQTAEVFVNENFVGKHIGGYSAFAFDITDSVEFDKPNLIAVKVDNSLDKNIPPLDADFNMYGGIYRDVWLIATDETHFKVTDHASSGVKVETPKVSESSAIVKVSGTVINASERQKRIEVVSTIFDKRNRQVSVLNSTVAVNPKAEANFEQTSKQIYKPQLWSPENPNLYRVETVVKENNKILDKITNPLGFRWFQFDANEGFFLNGKYLKLRGTNKHQDYKGLGNAVPDALQVRDLEIIKENGFNFLRLAHYPQDPAVLEAADRLGLIIWEEIPIVNLITISKEFNENSKQMLRDMIRQHRNHPSILMWGFMNEIFLRSPKTEADVVETVKLAQDLQKICKEEDSSRPTTIAFDQGNTELYYTSGLAKVTDIIGWNLYHGWYYETFADFGKFIDAQHARASDKPLIISEYGANGDQRLHSLNPKRFDSTIEWQKMYHEAYLPQIDARKFIAGSAIWNQFDFGAEYRGETIPHLNQKGMFTYDRQPKDISFFYKANFSKSAVLHIAVRDWQTRGGKSQQTIDVYSNLKEIELFQNGVSLGKKSVGNYKKASWEVSFKDGKNVFVAQGFADKNLLTDNAEIFYKNPVEMNEIAVNVGSNFEFIDESGTVWQADQASQKGGWGFIGENSKEISTGRNILSSFDDPLFQTMREDLSGYNFDVADGNYVVELRFAEPKFQQSGQRIFDVKINGQTVSANLDLAEKVGFLQAFTQKFRVLAKGKQGILIEFSAIKDKPILSGVRVKRIL